MVDKELLYRKLRRLKAIGIIYSDINPKIGKKILESHSLLSDPSNLLEITPIESLREEIKSLKRKVATTSGENRKILIGLLHKGMTEDKDIIKRKIRFMKIKDIDSLIHISASLKTIKKIISGLENHLRIEIGE